MNKTVRNFIFGKTSWKRIAKSAITIALLSYLGLALFAYLFADSIIFPSPESSYTDNDAVEKVTLANGNKITLRTYSAPTGNSSVHILYNHGNALDLGRIDTWLKTITQQLNVSLTAYDYPGYGTSEGKPCEQSVKKAAEAVYQYMKTKGIPDSEIVIWGRSVGGGPATYLAATHPVAALILQSPFKSAFTVVTNYPILPFDRFRNINLINDIKCPLLIIHGKADRIIPFSHAEALYKAAEEPKYKLWIENAGHNDVDLEGGSKYWRAIKEFLHLK